MKKIFVICEFWIGVNIIGLPLIYKHWGYHTSWSIHQKNYLKNKYHI